MIKHEKESLVETTKDNLLEQHSYDIFRAYNLPAFNLDPRHKKRVLFDLQSRKLTFPFLLEVLESNRYPFTIMMLSPKVGMYIPPILRYGIHAFEYYINNIRHYEEVLRKKPSKAPSFDEIYMARNKVEFLKKFADTQILVQGYRFTRRYTDRMTMIENFVQNNISNKGVFTLMSNSRTLYDTDVKIIKYVDDTNEKYFNVLELRKIITKKTKVKNLEFSNISLLMLYKRVLEKFAMWKVRENNMKTEVPKALKLLLKDLDSVLNKENLLNQDSYLGIVTLQDD